MNSLVVLLSKVISLAKGHTIIFFLSFRPVIEREVVADDR